MKTIAVIAVLFAAAIAFSFSYRSYKQKTASELTARRHALEQRDVELRRRAEATQEAQRLTALQAEQAVADAEQQLTRMREEEAAAHQYRIETEAAMARLNQELDDLRRQKEQTIAMVEKTAEQRQAELTSIATAQSEALAKLRAVESEKAQLTSREAAHAAALEKQMELEKQAQERASHHRSAATR